MLREWADRAEEQIARWDHLTPDERAEAALAIIRAHLASDKATHSAS